MHPGSTFSRGQLTVYLIPFLPQESYDQLLWVCDVNFVRGEDSFVRAQWAGKPFVWHAYPQQQGAHRAKIRAFLERYTAALNPAGATAMHGLWIAWNGLEGGPSLAEAWHTFDAEAEPIARFARHWATDLATLPDLASGLVEAACRKV